MSMIICRLVIVPVLRVRVTSSYEAQDSVKTIMNLVISAVEL